MDGDALCALRGQPGWHRIQLHWEERMLRHGSKYGEEKKIITILHNSKTNRTPCMQVANDLYDALQQFFLLFPQLQKNDFYATGESYAGKYVPAISYKVVEILTNVLQQR